jgi:hypothetical protein
MHSFQYLGRTNVNIAAVGKGHGIHMQATINRPLHHVAYERLAPRRLAGAHGLIEVVVHKLCERRRPDGRLHRKIGWLFALEDCGGCGLSPPREGLQRSNREFLPGQELGNDPTNWWVPNNPCLEGLCMAAGFKPGSPQGRRVTRSK